MTTSSNAEAAPETPTEAAPAWWQATQRALALAARGELPIIELINTSEALTAAGHLGGAIELYRLWLEHTTAPTAYAARFNLAALLAHAGDDAGAEAQYRQALAERPAFRAARLNLGVLLERSGRPQQAQEAWRAVLDYADPQAPDPALDALAQAHLARLRAQLGALGRPAPGAGAPPLVSILIPTHNRPDYAELALQSALAQSYPNIEIVISDNSDDELTRERFAPYLASNPCIRYLRAPGCTAIQNFSNCYSHAGGDYINFLMDDDLFHPEKIQTMMVYMLGYPNVGLVTSVRQLINAHGELTAATPEFRRMFETTTLINGVSLAATLLQTGQNLIGEPTTVLFRKADLPDNFGMYHGRQFAVLPDMASWLAILARRDCVYLAEPLSYFRIHGEQDQRQRATQIRCHIEGFQLLCDAYQHNREFFAGQPDSHGALAHKLLEFIVRMANLRPDFKASGFDIEPIHAAVRQANQLLLTD